MPELQLGEQIPNFNLPSTTGENYLFEDYRTEHKGSWHIIVFFRGSWSPICLEELKNLEGYKDELTSQNILLTAISTDSLADLEQMVEEHHLSFPVLSDEFATVLEAFGVFLHRINAPYEDHGVHGEPAYFLIHETGKLMYQHKQTSPYGRPSPEDLVNITSYISERLRENNKS